MVNTIIELKVILIIVLTPVSVSVSVSVTNKVKIGNRDICSLNVPDRKDGIFAGSTNSRKRRQQNTELFKKPRMLSDQDK